MNEHAGIQPSVLSVDIGSSSVRASLYDTAGDPVAGSETKLEHDLDYTPDGGATKDPDELFNLVVGAIDGTLEGAGEREVLCVATSAFWHSLLGLDESGRPTTPILTWADRRAADDARELRDRLDEEEIHRRTGCVLHSSYWPAKLSWLTRTHPDAFEETERWVSPPEYIHLRLFGETSVGTSMASATGLFDQSRKSWDEGVLDALPIRSTHLSAVSDEPSTGLRGEWAKRWPSLAGVPWFQAAGDGACSNVGCGCVDESRLALMVGTSGAMRVLWKAESAPVPPGVWCYRAGEEHLVMGGALSNGGNLIEWMRETMRLPEPDETEKLLEKMEPDAHGLTLLPLLAGERGPGWADRANGVIAGLSMSSVPVEILRAAMESVALRFSLIAKMIEAASPGEKEIIATGGGLLGSPAWTRIMADALGKPITLSGVEEASSRGAALLALERLGELEIEKVKAPLGETFEPDKRRHEIYIQALARQRRLYEAVV